MEAAACSVRTWCSLDAVAVVVGDEGEWVADGGRPQDAASAVGRLDGLACERSPLSHHPPGPSPADRSRPI